MAAASRQIITIILVMMGMFSSSAFMVIYNKWLLMDCPSPSDIVSDPSLLDESGPNGNSTSVTTGEEVVPLPTCKGGDFPHPVLLTCIHMLYIWFFAAFAIHVLRVVPKPSVDRSVFWKHLVPFSVLVAFDIAFSNSGLLSLEASFVEMLKSGMPAVVLIISSVVGIEILNAWKIVVILLICSGLCLASYGEANFELTGFIFVLVAMVAGATRMVLSQLLLHHHHHQQPEDNTEKEQGFGRTADVERLGSIPKFDQHSSNTNGDLEAIQNGDQDSPVALSPSLSSRSAPIQVYHAPLSTMQILYYQTPISFLVLAPFALVAVARGSTHVSEAFHSSRFWTTTGLITVGAVVAFILDIFNLLMVKVSSALSTTVAGCVKTAFIVLISWVVFRNEVTPLNIGGYCVCIAGVVAYNIAKYHALVQQEREKQATDAELRHHPLAADDDDLHESLLHQSSSNSGSAYPSPVTQRHMAYDPSGTGGAARDPFKD